MAIASVDDVVAVVASVVLDPEETALDKDDSFAVDLRDFRVVLKVDILERELIGEIVVDDDIPPDDDDPFSVDLKDS